MNAASAHVELNALKLALPANETARLGALQTLQILDTPPEEAYDAITRQVARVCGVPLAVISLVDENRQWYKSVAGDGGARETPRELSLCTHTILGAQLMEVPDTRADMRFARNPLVTGEPHVRFYAGVPLIDSNGHALGALCAIDYRRRQLDDSQRAAMMDLAVIATTLLEQRRIAAEANQLGVLLGQAFDEILVISPARDCVLHASAGALQHLGYQGGDLDGIRLSSIVAGYPLQELARLGTGDSGATAMTFEAEHFRRDGSVYPVEVRASVAPGTPEPRIIVLANDISSRKTVPAGPGDSSCDFVTRVSNRQALEAQLERSMAMVRRNRVPFALLMVEIDRLQEIRHGYGAQVAGRVLADFGVRLRKCAGAQGLVAHLGGDEFAVVTAPVTDPRTLRALMVAIGQSLDQPFQCEGSHFLLGAHIGAVHCSGDDETVDDLIERGYDAINLAVLSGTSQYVEPPSHDIPPRTPTAAGTSPVVSR